MLPLYIVEVENYHKKKGCSPQGLQHLRNLVLAIYILHYFIQKQTKLNYKFKKKKLVESNFALFLFKGHTLTKFILIHNKQKINTKKNSKDKLYILILNAK